MTIIIGVVMVEIVVIIIYSHKVIVMVIPRIVVSPIAVVIRVVAGPSPTE